MRCDKVYQLLAHGRWSSASTPASSTTKTDRHDIAEISLKVLLNTINQIKSKNCVSACLYLCLFVVVFSFFLWGPCCSSFNLFLRCAVLV